MPYVSAAAYKAMTKEAAATSVPSKPTNGADKELRALDQLIEDGNVRLSIGKAYRSDKGNATVRLTIAFDGQDLYIAGPNKGLNIGRARQK